MTANSYKTFTLITGASGGIGAEFAKLCAAEGRNLILVARHSNSLHRLAKQLGSDSTVHVIMQDLSEHGAAEKVYKKVRRLRANVDQLINNAGVGDFGPFAQADIGRQEQMISLNITALAVLTRLLLPGMIKQKHGRILNVSSVSGFAPLPLMSVYAASKSFVLSFSEALSEELRDTGVSVTCLCPGPTKTNFAHSARLDPNNHIARTRVSPQAVAKYGQRAMMAGTPVAVPKIGNRLLTSVVYRLLPRFLVRRIVRHYNR